MSLQWARQRPAEQIPFTSAKNRGGFLSASRFLFPVRESAHQLSLELRRQSAVGQGAQKADGRFHLPQVAPAVTAHSEVHLNSQSLPETQLSLHIACD
jgi:hypothetical protein